MNLDEVFTSSFRVQWCSLLKCRHVGAFRNLMVWGHFPRITQCKERIFDGNLFECCFSYFSFWAHRRRRIAFEKIHVLILRPLRRNHSSIFPNLGTVAELARTRCAMRFCWFLPTSRTWRFPSVFWGWTFSAFRNLCLEHVSRCLPWKMGGVSQ